MTSQRYQAVIIGAGFFGIEIALELKRLGFENMLLVEREGGIMRRASYVNQARVHQGYHYPRSLATAERSRANFEAFTSDYAEAVVGQMNSVYAIASGSKVSGPQFETFCRMVGLFYRPAPHRLAELFDSTMIEATYVTREFAFDSSRLANRLIVEIETAGIEIRLGTTARIRGGDAGGVDVEVGTDVVRAEWVFNCTYADIEGVGIDLTSKVKRELAEIVLIAPPRELDNLGVTVMDGPFFSTMPFPSAGVHSLSHVRYTPHESTTSFSEPLGQPHRSNRTEMLRDSQRFLPCLSRAHIVGSIFDIKATLIRNEEDDGRPILIERSDILPRVLSILGAKIDNIYDVRAFLRAQNWNAVS